MREVAMDFFQDKRFWHAIAALIVVVILAVMFWPRNQPTVAPAPATTNSPATVPTPSPSTAPFRGVSKDDAA
jgi:hypothetical protein